MEAFVKLRSVLLISFLALFLAACQSAPKKDDGPPKPVRVDDDPPKKPKMPKPTKVEDDPEDLPKPTKVEDGPDPKDKPKKDTPSTTTEPISGVLRVCAWNIEKLGTSRSSKPDRDYALMMKIIRENCDVVGVSEVMALIKGERHPGYVKLKEQFSNYNDKNNGKWSSFVSSYAHPGKPSHVKYFKSQADFDEAKRKYATNNDEKYAFFWNEAVVRRCKGFKAGAPEVDTGVPSRKVFSRPPAVACFRTPGDAKKNIEFDFLFAVFHAKRRINNKDRPAAELKDGLMNVVRYMHKTRGKELDLIIAGDFNLSPGEMNTIVNDIKAKSPQVNGKAIPKDALQVVFEAGDPKTTINKDGARTKNLFDNFIIVYPGQTTEYLGHEKNKEHPHAKGAKAVIDSTKRVPKSRATNLVDKTIYHHKAVSDHLMIRALFKSELPDDD